MFASHIKLLGRPHMAQACYSTIPTALGVFMAIGDFVTKQNILFPLPLMSLSSSF